MNLIDLVCKKSSFRNTRSLLKPWGGGREVIPLVQNLVLKIFSDFKPFLELVTCDHCSLICGDYALFYFKDDVITSRHFNYPFNIFL